MEGLSNSYIMVSKLRTSIKLILEMLRTSKDDETKHQLTQAHNILMDLLLKQRKEK